MKQRINNSCQKEHYSSLWTSFRKVSLLPGAWPLTALLCHMHPALASPAGLAVPSTEDPGSKELQQKAQCLCWRPWFAVPGTLLEYDLPQTLEKRRGGKYWDLSVCQVLALVEDWTTVMLQVHSFPPQEVYPSLWNCSGAQRASH